ncbi:polymeric immunoglobulin receptor-like [Mastacembelus armatus]|uniref:polymeric immunoglobulin receptor-like n=1 Tax=Mastacembelus armatus TaxID=205130 RepID=UPI000E45A680|nr:polymeric immunoglobulin receptor-like [Mastacembelus armatus]
MRGFLLLILTLMAGCEASSEVKGCKGGWVEFSCKYPKEGNIEDQSTEVDRPNKPKIVSSVKNMWENKDNISLFHDTKNKRLRVVIRELRDEDFGKYKCKFFQRQGSKHDTKEQEIKLEKEDDICKRLFNQTAYRNAKTTITCDYPGNKYSSRVKFFCKDKGSTCEDILSTKSSPLTNGTFTLTNTNRGFSVSISNVSSQDDGVYWCGLKPKEGSSRAATRRIQLKVQDITTSRIFSTVGQDLTFWCIYPNGSSIKKFICKGEDPSVCQRLVSTAQRNMNTGRFSMKDDTTKANITVTIRNMRLDDNGTYWCGADSTDPGRSDEFFHKLLITVDESWLTLVIAVITSGAVLVLVFVFCVVFFCKRSERLRNARNKEAQENNDDHSYAEIQELPQKPNSGTALKTVYATANFPTHPSASILYSKVILPTCSAEVKGDTYCTVTGNGQSSACSTVNQPSRLSEDHL